MKVYRRRCLGPPVNLASTDVQQATASPGETPTREEIAQRAFQKWLSRGCPNYAEVLDWLEAEAEFKRDLSGQPQV